MDIKLLKHFTSIQKLSKVEIEAIDETMIIRNFKKGSILLKEGQFSKDVFFVLNGIVRQYYLADGVEKTSDFFTDGQWVLSANNVINGMASKNYLDCCTDCTLVVGDSEKGDDLYLKFPNLGVVSRKLMNQVFIEQQSKLEAYILNTPTVRYLNLMKSNPDLFQHIPQYQIASYIGVTPESLSRIRKRISKKS